MSEFNTIILYTDIQNQVNGCIY